MKRLSPILLLLMLIIHFSSCEKDDICVEGDTPLLVIGFFDIEDTISNKSVNSLRIRELGSSEPIDGSIESEIVPITAHSDRTSADSTGIPLKTFDVTTSFEFIINSTDNDEMMETGNIDTITFNYTINDRFVSRACGFVANYDNLSAELQLDDGNWIDDISIADTTIENSTAIHVKIFH